MSRLIPAASRDPAGIDVLEGGARTEPVEAVQSSEVGLGERAMLGQVPEEDGWQ